MSKYKNKCLDCISENCESKVLIETINKKESTEMITRHCGLYIKNHES